MGIAITRGKQPRAALRDTMKSGRPSAVLWTCVMGGAVEASDRWASAASPRLAFPCAACRGGISIWRSVGVPPRQPCRGESLSGWPRRLGVRQERSVCLVDGDVRDVSWWQVGGYAAYAVHIAASPQGKLRALAQAVSAASQACVVPDGILSDFLLESDGIRGERAGLSARFCVNPSTTPRPEPKKTG